MPYEEKGLTCQSIDVRKTIHEISNNNLGNTSSILGLVEEVEARLFGNDNRGCGEKIKEPTSIEEYINTSNNIQCNIISILSSILNRL